MESTDPKASTDKIHNKQARGPDDVLVLYEPTEEGERRWIMLHVLLRDKVSPESIPKEEALRLPNTFDDWCEWREQNAKEVTGTIMFSESPDNPRDMLIESLFIERAYRRQGFGTRLVKGMRSVCKQKGRSRMLAATQFRAKAMPFWMAMGLQRDLETGTPFIPVVSSNTK